MFRFLAVTVIALGLWAPAQASAVVDGTPADLADYPYFTVVGTGCGGALIGPRRVLTAAHCVESLNESDKVRVGPRRIQRTIILRAILPLHVRELAKMEREFPPPAGDLMLLALDRPVRGVPLARIAAPADGLTAPGTTVTTIGRGAAGSDGSGQGVFRSGTVQIQPAGICADQLSTPLLRDWSLCVRDPRMADPDYPGPFVSACFGDSGGPLLADGGQGNRIVGVVSWGPSCGEERDPEIYANAVRGRSFALRKRPIWAPQAIGRPRVVGRTRVGQTVRCRIRWRQRPTRKLAFNFVLDGRQVQSGPRVTYRIRPADRGRRISCDGGGETAGGRGGSLQLAPARLVR
ncbi:MAG: trypsin-like serine protease [Solirubrobacterales bacterium]|nr:trypsin-like serine protease [Solirubrobacterales bacterium]